ncbi:hypothetical protein B0H19DRAFT_1375907 [Mycena capillaripes]|nr:hypothetical protein B0H19DRAFT_1375907 [Mycena capillaripes]
MADVEKGGIKLKQGINPDEDAAAAKLWTVYVSEAEKYDRSLVETWKSDMEGLLIFAALFSAILTAFIIESYKSLTLDPGDITVHLLTNSAAARRVSEWKYSKFYAHPLIHTDCHFRRV